MSEPEKAPAPTGHREPSFAASLFVLGIMIALILFSVVEFGAEVAEGPLQVSMTLATLVALGVAYFHGYRGAVISEAIQGSVSGTLGTMMVLLAIGAIIGALYLAGTVAAFIYYGVAILEPRFYYIIVFAIAAVLSILLGSSLTTVAAVGVPFVGLASAMGVDPAIAAGAALSGAVLGDKTAKISDTAVLTIASVGGVTSEEHARSVMRTALPAVALSAVAFFILGVTGAPSGTPVDAGAVQAVITQHFAISPLAFVPVLLIFALSALRLSAFLCLMIPAIAAVLLAAVTQHDLITALANDPGGQYWRGVLAVGIDVIATGFHLRSGDPTLDSLFSGGGTTAMLTTIWLILVAASFAAITDYTGMLQRLIAPVISVAKGAAGMIVVTMLTSLGLNAVSADPYVSIVLAARMFRARFMAVRLQPVTLSTAIADSGTIVSYIIPWNVHGALVAGTLGIGVVAFAPYAFVVYLTPLVTGALAFYYSRRRLAQGEDAKVAYGPETALPIPEHGA